MRKIVLGDDGTMDTVLVCTERRATMGHSRDERSADGRLINGYDYDKQVWIKNGRYVRCGHPETMQCNCYGRIHAGEAS